MSDMPKLEGVLKGIKSVQARAQPKQKTCLPVTPAILLRICSTWEQQTGPKDDHLMLWAAATLCFFGFMRSGEITVPSDGSFDCKAHMTY